MILHTEVFGEGAPIVLNEAIDSEHSRAEGITKMAEAYKKINSGHSLEGYKMLLEQDLLSKEAIKEELAQQLKR